MPRFSCMQRLLTSCQFSTRSLLSTVQEKRCRATAVHNDGEQFVTPPTDRTIQLQWRDAGQRGTQAFGCPVLRAPILDVGHVEGFRDLYGEHIAGISSRGSVETVSNGRRPAAGRESTALKSDAWQ